MAGRGRGGGRGRGMPAFVNKETRELLSIHGIGRVDNVPPPIYDLLCYTKPQSLLDDIEQDYLVRKRQVLREDAKRLPYQVKIKAKKKDVECYSDKYEKDLSTCLQPDWSLLPPELNTTLKRRKRKGGGALNQTSRLKKPLITQVASHLEELEKNETEVQEDEEEPEVSNVEKKKVEGDEDEEEPIDEDEYDEAEYEEDNDYAKNYYESEDSRGGDDEDNDADAYYS